MNRWNVGKGLYGALIALILTFVLLGQAESCTRALYFGSDGVIITGRSMDWLQNTGTDLWAFPAGMKRNGAAGPNSLQWVSKYGSVISSFYNCATVDGMNEKGLVGNVLYLTESEYPQPDGKRPTMSIAAWAQYVLDNYATVSEAVKALSDDKLVVIAPTLPDGKRAAGHLALSDPTGDSAILEYIKGKLVIHHGKEYQVMTNSPTYDQQLALNTYWRQIGGMEFLPGTIRASDRFARASFFINAIPDVSEVDKAVAGVFSVIRAVSVPLGISVKDQPNLAATLWRTVSDHKNKVYFFDSATSPTTFWVPLADLELKEGAEVKKLKLTGGETYAGSAAPRFEPAQPFAFLPAEGK